MKMRLLEERLIKIAKTNHQSVVEFHDEQRHYYEESLSIISLET